MFMPVNLKSIVRGVGGNHKKNFPEMILFRHLRAGLFCTILEFFLNSKLSESGTLFKLKIYSKTRVQIKI
jgi:hypothetical protein